MSLALRFVPGAGWAIWNYSQRKFVRTLGMIQKTDALRAAQLIFPDAKISLRKS